LRAGFVVGCWKQSSGGIVVSVSLEEQGKPRADMKDGISNKRKINTSKDSQMEAEIKTGTPNKLILSIAQYRPFLAKVASQVCLIDSSGEEPDDEETAQEWDRKQRNLAKESVRMSMYILRECGIEEDPVTAIPVAETEVEMTYAEAVRKAVARQRALDKLSSSERQLLGLES
jgi:hypothetical protein